MEKKAINKNIKNFAKVFEKIILDSVENKEKVCLTLSGGMDTRTILSVLVKNNIKFDAFTHNQHLKVPIYKNEIEVATQLGKKYAENHIFLEQEDGRWDTKEKHEALEGYDIVLFGLLMTEYLSKFEFFHLSENGYKNMYAKCLTEKNKFPSHWFVPMLEEKVLEAYRDIPYKYLIFSNVQRSIIEMNMPELLQYKFTSYNYKRSAAAYLYRKVGKRILK